MNDDLEAKVRKGLREIADVRAAVPPVPRAAPAARKRAHLRWAVPVSAAVVVALLLILIPRFEPRAIPPAATDAVTLPSSLAGFSFLTGDLAQAPIGPVIAVYHERSEAFEDYMDWRTTVIEAGADRYRRVGTLELGSPGDMPAEVMISPDGRLLANLTGATLTLVEMATATVTEHSLPDGARLLTWSPDGRWLVFVFGGAGQLMTFDTESGDDAAIPGLTGVTEAAYSHDGSLIALQIGADVVFATRTGDVDRRVTVPPDLTLISDAGWSPEGRTLAMLRRDGSSSRVAFIDARTGQRPGSMLSDVDGDTILGWRTSGSVVMRLDEGLVEVPIDGGPRTTLVAIRHNVASVKLAAGLLAGANVRTPAAADRGPWPVWAQIALAAFVVALIGPPVAFIVVRRRTRRVSASRFPS